MASGKFSVFKKCNARLTKGLVCGLFFVLSASAVFAQQIATQGFDVNDVNYLFPRTHNTQSPLYPAIQVSNSKFLTAELFGEIVEKFKTETAGGADYNSFSSPNFEMTESPYFYVVNFRYDPCFLEVATQTCVQQIRLVLQPFNANLKLPGFDDGIPVPDYAIHLLYKLGEGLPAKDDLVLKELVDLKRLTEQQGVSQNGLPLDVSPALVAEFKSRLATDSPDKLGPFALKLKSIIEKFATMERLQEATVINGSSDEGFLGNWNFMGGQIKQGHWVPQPIPRTGGRLLQRSDVAGLIVEGRPSQAPLITDVDDVKSLNAKGDALEIKKRFFDLERILDPTRTNPRNTDCASCHMADNSRQQLAASLRSSFRPLQGEVVSYQSAHGITASPSSRPYDTSGSTYRELGFTNVHVIGYLNNTPIVSSLVANSAAEVAAILNKILHLEAVAQ